VRIVLCLGYTGRISCHPVSVQTPDFRQIGDAHWEAFAAGWHVKFFAEHPVFLLEFFSLERQRSAPQYWAFGRRVDGARAHRQLQTQRREPERRVIASSVGLLRSCCLKYPSSSTSPERMPLQSLTLIAALAAHDGRPSASGRRFSRRRWSLSNRLCGCCRLSSGRARSRYRFPRQDCRQRVHEHEPARPFVAKTAC